MEIKKEKYYKIIDKEARKIAKKYLSSKIDR